jgi:hypothetical protein
MDSSVYAVLILGISPSKQPTMIRQPIKRHIKNNHSSPQKDSVELLKISAFVAKWLTLKMAIKVALESTYWNCQIQYALLILLSLQLLKKLQQAVASSALDSIVYLQIFT